MSLGSRVFLCAGRLARARVLYAADFFGRAAYLTVSGQLSAETYACALGDVYTFGPTFRAENSNTFSRKKRASVASYQSRTSPPRPGNFSATTQQRSPGGNFFSVRFSELLALGTAFGSSKVRAHVLASSLFLPTSVHDVAPRPRSLRRCRFRYASPARGGACACSRDEPATSVAAHHGGSGWWLR